MADETPVRYRAKLIRGSVYYLESQVFQYNVPKEVDQATKETLDRDAFDLIKIEHNMRKEPKFTFELIDPSKPEAKPEARARQQQR